METEKDITRFDGWSVLIPKVGQVIQVHLGEHIFETPVILRTTSDKKTFRIIVAHPYGKGNIMLVLTFTATGRERIGDDPSKKPYWQTVPQSPDETCFLARLFFLN